ncbi:Uncharacterised protein [uncultured archaeon]|nr:Uncharacterised protein [uncultured archaeon]
MPRQLIKEVNILSFIVVLSSVFVKMRKGELNKMMSAAIRKAGSERKLTKATGIPPITIYYYSHEIYNITQERFELLAAFLGISRKETERGEKTLLPSNWGRVKGGKNCLAKKKRDGTWKSNFNKMMIGSSRNLKAWHRKMKREQPIEYYHLQYERFKKVGAYKLVAKRGEKVRNSLEKDVADLLYGMKLEYEYEPLVKGKEKYYFPDFKVKNLLIECSMWRGEEKAYKLLHKIKDLQKEGYLAIVVVPRQLRHFYKVLDEYLVTDIGELKEKIICLGSSVSS